MLLCFRTFVVTAPKIARVGTPYTVSVVLTELRNAVQTGTISLTHTTDATQTKSVSFTIDQTGILILTEN